MAITYLQYPQPEYALSRNHMEPKTFEMMRDKLDYVAHVIVGHPTIVEEYMKQWKI